MDDEDYLSRPEDQYIIEEVLPETEPGWTTNPDEAVDEAEPYLPPTDPPLVAGSNQTQQIATGFGTSPEDGLDAAAGETDGWIEDEVRRVLRSDSATHGLPLEVRVENGIAIIEGVVSDLDDADNVEAVAARVPGVQSVIDRTTVDPEAIEHLASQ